MSSEMPTYEELYNAYNEMSQQLRQAENNNNSMHDSMTAQSIINEKQQNLVQWQLDISQELKVISHMLRGHIVKRDNEGNEFWSEPDDAEQKIFNEKGAQEIEKVIRNYLIKNVLLSNYGLKEINHRVMQFAHRLRRFIYLNFEDFGMDTEYKQRHFEMIVMNISDQIESAYLRALGGEERKSLRENIHITQNENPSQQYFYPNSTPTGQKQGGSKLNPVNWFK